MPTSIATSNRPSLCVFISCCLLLFVIHCFFVLCVVLLFFSLILYLLLAYTSFETSYVFSLSLHAMNIMRLFL